MIIWSANAAASTAISVAVTSRGRNAAAYGTGDGSGALKIAQNLIEVMSAKAPWFYIMALWSASWLDVTT